MDQEKQIHDQPDSKRDIVRPIWDNAEKLSSLRDRAGQCGDQLAKVLFQASLQTLDDQQQAQAYRDRVTAALMSMPDKAPATGTSSTTQNIIDETLPPVPEHHLKPPHPVSLYEDPLKYKAPNPASITAMTDKEQEHIAEEMEASRNTAIFLTDVHNELFRPMLGLAACVALIMLIGYGAYVKGWIGHPKTVTAAPVTVEPQSTPIQTPAE